MGTNYYLCPIIKEEEFKKLFNKAIDSEKKTFLKFL